MGQFEDRLAAGYQGGAAVTDETVLEEAQRLVMGPRQSSYAHPSQDFRATGRQWGALLENWLRSEGYALVKDVGETDEGEYVVEEWADADFPDVPPRLVALMMAALKASRESQKHARDNIVDLAGYALCAWRVEEE